MRAAPHAKTFHRRAIFSLVFAALVIAFSWTSLVSFKHSLSLSHLTITDSKKGSTFDVYRCGSDTRYRTGRVDDKTGVARISVPFGCYDVRPQKDDTSGFQARRIIAPSTGADRLALFMLGGFGVLALGLLYPVTRAIVSSRRAVRARSRGEVFQARVDGDDSRQWSAYVFGSGVAVVVVAGLIGFLSLSNGLVRTPFFRFSLMTGKFGLLLEAFKLNLFMAFVAEAFVLIWGLFVAIARLAPGKAGRPVRALAIVYIDLFRGVPAVLVIYLLGFGLPQSKLPWLGTLPRHWYAIIALTLTYGAYVAEVYRSGIESIHWSQTAAARSLGLSGMATTRHVILPQAVRRIIPPLLNDFIGLQKDTALASFISANEILNQAKQLNSTYFNLSALTVAAFLFYIITVPQARGVDVLLKRDQTRMRAGA